MIESMDWSLLPKIPPEPRSVEDTNLPLGLLANLALRTMYTRGFLRAHEIAESMRLPFAGVVEKVIDHLRREHFTEVRGSTGFGESSYQYVITEEGRARARELMTQSQYVGPAPVPFEAYVEMVRAQSLEGEAVTLNALKRALSHLVLKDLIINQLGPAINSGKSLFLFGNAGNGKTSIAEAIGKMLPGVIWIPYAVTANENFIKVFDALHHEVLSDKISNTNPSIGLRRGERYDQRWVLIKRPLISAGGEMGLKDLDLVYDPVKKYYEAPYQMRANGGVFLVDDFGRQQASPRDLLNRWIVPLEKRVDHLTLETGHKIDVPFDSLIIFATNLNPKELVDEAFLRRILYKIHIPDPSWEEYREIFRRAAKERGIPYTDEALRFLITRYYLKTNRRARAVHSRDLLDELVEIARFHGVPPVLSEQLISLACQTYFLA